MSTARKPRAKKLTAAEELAADHSQTVDVEGLESDGIPTSEEQAPPNGVLVLKFVDEQGNISTDAQPIGNVQGTEVQTLLELGINSWRHKIGLSGQP